MVGFDAHSTQPLKLAQNDVHTPVRGQCPGFTKGMSELEYVMAKHHGVL